MKTLLVVAVMLAAGEACALDPWTPDDTQRALVLAALAAVDIAATDYVLRQDVKPSERNPILGRDPSSAKLWGLGAVAVIAHVGVGRLLPRGARDAWQASGIAIELGLGVTGGTVALSYAF